MKESVRAENEFYILADTSLAEEHRRVLKQGDTFAVFGSSGNIGRYGFEDQGLYHADTRHLSRLVVTINGKPPLLLSSAVRENNDGLGFDLMNPDVPGDHGSLIKRGTVHALRSMFLFNSCYYESISLTNYGAKPVRFDLRVEFAADYRDIFEIRGIRRHKRGTIREPQINSSRALLSYEGLDGAVRRTELTFSPTPDELTADHASFHLLLEPRMTQDLFLTVPCARDAATVPPSSFDAAYIHVRQQLARYRRRQCTVETSNQPFNAWLNRSCADLSMMMTETEHGFYPYAGIPWFSTIFGRDGLITALETLWVYPKIARGVLSCLAATQAQECDPDREAEPGKILHELRRGEMASTGEVPFGRYYGSIDSTPLFVVLAGYYYQRTGDLKSIREIWPALERATEWMDRYGDLDGDGFLEYQGRVAGGLVQQGWKDSEDSVFHADGRTAEPPIALCEVQAYAYEAKRQMAQLALLLGRRSASEDLRQSARRLRLRFQEQFWSKEIGMYALALDASKQPCTVRSSNAGQCLFSGIAEQRDAETITDLLVGDTFFTGWGIRTLASGESRYNPMSYHNGSIWPHDNALIASGLSRYGHRQATLKVLTGLFEASLFLESSRLPELFCGLPRRPNEGPTLYPVACLPQSWASAAVFLLLQACLGLSIDGHGQTVTLTNPLLPRFLDWLSIRSLQVGAGQVDLVLHRHQNDASVNVSKRDGSVDVVVRK